MQISTLLALGRKIVRSSVLLTFIVFLCGLAFRIYRYDLYPLQFDQIQILTHAAQIRMGDLNFVGPRTGPVEMFTGPFVYYLTAFLSFFISTPWTVVGMAVVLYILTFWVIRSLFVFYRIDKRISFFFLLFYAVSLYQVTLDRIPWNPNLMMLASTLVFVPMRQIISHKNVRILDAIFLALGVFIGYQAHFSGLFLILFVLCIGFLPVRNKKYAILAGVLGSVTTLFPTFIFDLKHQWLNLHGVMDVLKNNHGTVPTKEFFLLPFIRDIFVSLENIGKFLIPQTEQYLAIAAGIIVVLWTIQYARHHKNRETAWFPLLWFCSINLLFFPYKGPKPEYYFLIQFPAILWMVATMLSHIRIPVSKLLFAIVLSFSTIHFIGLVSTLNSQKELMIGSQVEASKVVREKLRENPDLHVAIDIQTLNRAGLNYLLKDVPEVRTQDETLNVVHLIYPANDRTPTTKRFGSLVYWEDPRRNSQEKYLLVDNVVIGSPPSLELFRDEYPSKEFDMASSQYVIFREGEKVGRLLLLVDDIDNIRRKDFLKQFEEEWGETVSDWQPVDYKGGKVYLQAKKKTVFLLQLLTDDEASKKDSFQLKLYP
ncbi:hypothetical protein KBD71_00130 [Candidatus Woesebacteria bacterium]|nr:hypothetical protein [Candidatus Woesebacteria bacterium]